MTEEYIKNGSIYQHESGEFRIRERKGRAYEVEFAERPSLWTSTGKRVFEEADAFVKRLLHESKRYLPNEKVTFIEFAGTDYFTRPGKGSYRERCERFGKRYDERYYRNKNGFLRNYILPEFSKWDVTKITTAVIEDWYVGLTQFRHPGKKLCDEQKIYILDALSDIMDDMQRKGVLKDNPCDKVQRITVRRESNKEVFSKEEIAMLFPNDREKLLAVWDGSLMWALYFSIMVDTGFRYSEVAGLNIENIDENGGVYTRDSVGGIDHNIRHRIKTTSKGKGAKFGVLSTYTMNLLEEYKENLPTNYLFQYCGRFVYCNMANERLRRACYNAGIDPRDRTQHCFRHTFDTNMLNNLGNMIEESDVRDLMAHTGYRPEYDHRTPEQILFRLLEVKPAIEQIRESQRDAQ